MITRKPWQPIRVKEARAFLKRDDVLIVDVRDPATFANGHIPEAQNVSIANLAAVIHTAPRDLPILVYCYHGYASQEYAQIFVDFRFQEVYSLEGGYEAWLKQGALPERLARWLVENDFPADDPNAPIANRTTPLMKAAHLAAQAAVLDLIEAGANLDARNADGNTALWLACVSGDLSVVSALIEAGADIDNLNDNHATALMYAASSGKADMVERLLAAGANTCLATLDGFTALDMAATAECLRLLRAPRRRLGPVLALSAQAPATASLRH